MIRMEIKTVNRRTGRTATGAAAYRTASKIEDERTGRKHDYTRKGGVIASGVIGPIQDRAVLWNTAEASENRKNSTVARELIVSLPHEATAEQQVAAVRKMSEELRLRYGVAVDFAIHQANAKGDARNTHAHIMFTTRSVNFRGEFGKKTRILDVKQTSKGEVTELRKKWAELCQPIAQDPDQWDHRSLAQRGIKRIPQPKLGPAAVGFERRTGLKSEVRKRAESAEAVASRIQRQKLRVGHHNQEDDSNRRKLQKEAKKELPKAPDPLRGLRRWWPRSKEAFAKRKERYERIRESALALKKRAERELAGIETRRQKRRGVLKFLDKLDAERDLTPGEEKLVQEWNRAKPLKVEVAPQEKPRKKRSPKPQ